MIHHGGVVSSCQAVGCGLLYEIKNHRTSQRSGCVVKRTSNEVSALRLFTSGQRYAIREDEAAGIRPPSHSDDGRKYPITPKRKAHRSVCFSFWWERVDSNHRRHRQQIYSLSPLATRERSHMKLKCGAGRRTRTPDLLITNQLLYQLSYTSVFQLDYNNKSFSICQCLIFLYSAYYMGTLSLRFCQIIGNLQKTLCFCVLCGKISRNSMFVRFCICILIHIKESCAAAWLF